MLVTASSTLEPTLSVVVPTHNVAPWIVETLQSLAAQSLADLEVIVVDDRSEDETSDLVDEFSAQDARFRLVRADSPGGGNARNTGARLAKGRYLAFCDGDDIVPEEGYERLVASLEASGSDIAFGQYLKYSPTKAWVPTQGWAAFQEPARGIELADRPSLIRGRAVWNKVFRREFWVRCGAEFPDVPRSNDIRPMTVAYLAADRVDVLSEITYLYRERPGTTSMSARAGRTASLVSYLTQEAQCAELVDGTKRDALRSAYGGMFYESDGWVHIAGYLRDMTSPPTERESAEIVRQLRSIRESVPEFRFKRLPVERRMILELTAAGCFSDAATMLSALESSRTALDETDARAWTTALDMYRRLPGGAADVFDLVRVRLAPTLAYAIRDRVGMPEKQLVELVRLADASCTAKPWSPLERIPELVSLRTVDDQAIAERIRASRSRSLEIHGVVLRRFSVEIRGAGSAKGLQLLPGKRVISRSDERSWRLTIPVHRLPATGKAHLVAKDGRGTLTQVALPELADTIRAYRRLGFLDAGRTGDGTMWIERRPNLIRRGAGFLKRSLAVRAGRA